MVVLRLCCCLLGPHAEGTWQRAAHFGSWKRHNRESRHLTSSAHMSGTGRSPKGGRAVRASALRLLNHMTHETVLTSLTWGGFQSLIQLSVGVNGAFAALTTFAGDSAQKEERRINKILSRLSNIPSSKMTPAVTQNKMSAMFLSGRLASVSRRYNYFINSTIRLSCVLCALIGVVVLVYSSYKFDAPIEFRSQMIVHALMLPFIVGSLYSTFLSYHVHRSISRDRQKIEHEMRTF